MNLNMCTCIYTSASTLKNGYFLSNSGVVHGHSNMFFLLWAKVASINSEKISTRGCFLFHSSRSCVENLSNEQLSSPRGILGGFIQSTWGDFVAVVCRLLDGVLFDVLWIASHLVDLRSLRNSLNRFWILITIAP